jgi:hypothetical protein
MLLSMLISSAPGCSSACWLCWPNWLHHLAGSSTCQQHDGHHTLPNWLGVCRWRPYCCWRTAAVPTGSNNSTGRGNQLGGVQWYVCTETLFHMCVHLLIVPCCRVHVSACVASILAPDLGTTGIQLLVLECAWCFAVVMPGWAPVSQSGAIISEAQSAPAVITSATPCPAGEPALHPHQPACMHHVDHTVFPNPVASPAAQCRQHY